MLADLSAHERAAARRAAFVESEKKKERLRSLLLPDVPPPSIAPRSPPYISPRGVRIPPLVLESLKLPRGWQATGAEDKATPANLDDRLEAVYEDSCLTKPSRSFSDVDGESGAEWLQSKLMPLTCHCAWEVGHAAGTACLDCLTCSSYPQVSTIYL